MGQYKEYYIQQNKSSNTIVKVAYEDLNDKQVRINEINVSKYSKEGKIKEVNLIPSEGLKENSLLSNFVEHYNNDVKQVSKHHFISNLSQVCANYNYHVELSKGRAIDQDDIVRLLDKPTKKNNLEFSEKFEEIITDLKQLKSDKKHELSENTLESLDVLKNEHIVKILTLAKYDLVEDKTYPLLSSGISEHVLDLKMEHDKNLEKKAFEIVNDFFDKGNQDQYLKEDLANELSKIISEASKTSENKIIKMIIEEGIKDSHNQFDLYHFSPIIEKKVLEKLKEEIDFENIGQKTRVEAKKNKEQIVIN